MRVKAQHLVVGAGGAQCSGPSCKCLVHTPLSRCFALMLSVLPSSSYQETDEQAGESMQLAGVRS